MYYLSSRKKKLAKKLFFMALTAVSIVIGVTVLTALMLGYSFNFNGTEGHVERIGILQVDSKPNGGAWVSGGILHIIEGTAQLGPDQLNAFHQNGHPILHSIELKLLQDLPALTSYFFSEPKINLDLILNNKQLKKLTQRAKL